jgi:glycosyltransferase involved in cell wall biosynthesis
VIKELITQYHDIDIKYIIQLNQGPSKSRNNGAKISTGKYILFLDGDDLIAATYLSKCIACMENDSTLNIVFSDSQYFDAQTGAWKLPPYSLERMLIDNCIHISAVTRREIFNIVGGFDENINYTEDWELWIRIASKYGGVCKIPEILFSYRKRQDKSSLTDNINRDYVSEKSRLYIYSKHYNLYREFGYDFITLITSQKYKRKYYNVWYRSLFYKFKKKKH